MFESLDSMMEIQKVLLDSMEVVEQDLASVRDLLNSTLRDAAGLTPTDLLIVLIQAQAAITAAVLCSHQHASSGLRDVLHKQRGAMDELKREFDKLDGPKDPDKTE